MGTFQWEPNANSLSAMNDGLKPGPLMGSQESLMLDRKKTSKPRIFRQRRCQPRHSLNRKTPRPSASISSRNATPVPTRIATTLSRDNTMSRSLVKVYEAKDENADPQRALNLLRKSIETQPYSSISQREMAALIKKIEDVLLREKLYGSSSSDSGEVTIPSSLSDSISNSENIDPEYFTDATSVSSTPRVTVEEIPDAEPAEAQTAHKRNCPHCGGKPNYYCSKSDCGYFTHTRGDAKRHEEGEKHYPQARFMCCECPLAQADLDENGNPVCEFCGTFCLDFGLLRAHYLHCSDAKNRGKTFGRKDHFIQHLREEHTILNDAQHVAGSKYPVVSNWPRHCSRCLKTFQTWEQRMKHLAEHAEEDFHPQGFGKKPKDDDDDEDKDDHHGGGGRSQGKGVGRQFNDALPIQHNQASLSGNNAPSSHGHYRSRTQTVPSDVSSPEILKLSVTSRKPSLALERYLNDTESPVPIPLGYQKCEGQESSYHELGHTSARAHQQFLAIRTGPALQQLRTPASSQVPRPRVPAFDPVAAAYQAGKIDADAERFGFAERNYPIPIPSDKQEKALQLYVRYKREVKLALEPTSATNDSFRLMVPGPTTARSVASKSTHSQRATFISTSTYDGATDLSSAVSFDGNESSLSIEDQPGESISFSGEKVKQRARKRSNPTTGAKAALIRCLGSCSVCRSRRVPVSKFDCFDCLAN
jgi:hypothetical protein